MFLIKRRNQNKIVPEEVPHTKEFPNNSYCSFFSEISRFITIRKSRASTEATKLMTSSIDCIQYCQNK